MPDSHDALPDVTASASRNKAQSSPLFGQNESPKEASARSGDHADGQKGLRPAFDASSMQKKTSKSGLPPLPQRQVKSARWGMLSFLCIVVIPTVLVAMYYYFFAADQYVSEFKFAVTESSPILPGVPPSPTSSSTGGIGGSAMGAALAGGAGALLGGSNASMQNYIVTEYLLSREAVDELEKRVNLRALYDPPSLGHDYPARFGQGRFVQYWNRMVSARFDPATGIAVVSVRAFSPEDAKRIADAMVSMSEELVNKIARRPQNDAVQFAEGELKRAQERLKRARDALTEYRLEEGVIDPSGAITTNIALVQVLRTQLAQQQGDLATLLSQQQNQSAPAAQALRSRIAATKEQLDRLQKEVANNREGNRVLAAVVDRYERVDLERQYAQSMLIAAQQAYDQARANAAAQHLYLTPFVRPNLPEYPTYPKKIQSVLLAALGLFAVWVVGTMFVRTIGEHV